MRPTIQVILCGILPVTANGQLTLFKEPPFGLLLTPGWAALATIDIENDVRNVTQVFDFMAANPTENSPVIIGHHGRWITGDAYCVDRSPIHRGWRYKLAMAKFDWSTPCRLSDVVRQRKAA